MFFLETNNHSPLNQTINYFRSNNKITREAKAIVFIESKIDYSNADKFVRI